MVKDMNNRGQRTKIYPLDNWSGFDFRPQFIGELIPQIDCNNCKWLDMTEDEQQTIENGIYKYHHCMFYGERVKHRTSNVIHDHRLYPCKKCDEHNNSRYTYKDGEE